jgi:hypothetical protein
MNAIRVIDLRSDVSKPRYRWAEASGMEERG